MSAHIPPAKETHAPVSAPITPRKMRLMAVIRAGIHGCLSAKSSKAVRIVKITTAGTEPIRAMGPSSLIQCKWALHATAAGGENERRPLNNPIRKASAKTVISMFSGRVLEMRGQSPHFPRKLGNVGTVPSFPNFAGKLMILEKGASSYAVSFAHGLASVDCGHRRGRSNAARSPHYFPNCRRLV